MSPTVSVEGRTLSVTNLDKVLYPGDGTTKAELISYLVTVAPALLRQLHRRPVTRVRWPHGTEGSSFFEKNVPAGAPAWLPTATLDAPGSTKGRERIRYPLVEDTAALTWLGNLAALELHVPQWRVQGNDREGEAIPLPPDRLVVDLDPGHPAGLGECAVVALATRDALRARNIDDIVPVTSGSKGMQLYARLPGDSPAVAVREFAKVLAEELSGALPALVVSSMSKAVRPGRVFFDWSQNTAAKTTICPYSPRGRHPHATVAAPRTWAEVEAAADAEIDLGQLSMNEVAARLVADGDLMTVLDPQDRP